MSIEKFVGKYQCPGCILGNSPETCSSFKEVESGIGGKTCINHHSGTIVAGIGKILVGMPTGFDKIRGKDAIEIIRIYEEGKVPKWNFLNVPVWAMEYEENLLVKTCCPRTLGWNIDIVIGGKMENLGEYKDKVLDVSTILDKID